MSTIQKTPRKFEFILAWQNYRVGSVIEPNGVLRDWLLSRGYVREVLPEVAEGVADEIVDAPPLVHEVSKRRRGNSRG